MEPVPVLPRRPLWTDRQLIAAADLSAEQSWQDAQLARLRRYALGWGVVAGFEVTHEGGDLTIQPGYAISPLGNEIYLGKALVWKGFLTNLWSVCMPDYSLDCDNPAAATGEYDQWMSDAWLVVAPETMQSCPRPTLATGCANPGNTWALSRQSGALQFKIDCALDRGLLPDMRRCPDVQALFAAGAVPMPPEVSDIVPLAHILFSGRGIAETSIAERRRLLPLSEVAAALACCDCTKEEVVTPPPPPPTGTVWEKPNDYLLGDLFQKPAGFLPDPANDPKRLLSDIFKARVPPLGRPPEAADRDPLQAFVSAAMVTTKEELQLWELGDYPAIYTGAKTKPVIGRGVARPATLGRIKLGAFLEASPTITEFVSLFGTEKVADLEKIIERTKVGRGREPGVMAVLGFVQLRLGQMFKG